MPPKSKSKVAATTPKKPTQRKATKPAPATKPSRKRATATKKKTPTPSESSESPTTPSDESSSQEEEGSAFAHGSESYEFSEREEEDIASLHSDNLDDELEDIRPKSPTASPEKSKKRKRGSEAGSAKSSPAKKTKASPTKKPAKKKGKSKLDEYELGSESENSDEEEDPELYEGQEIVGRVVQAPKTGRVPPGQISQNTFNFLTELKKPECNDRQWFKLHEPVYRLAEQEWKDFVDEFTTLLTEVDPQVPPLPAKDIIHRIYRDIRFSNDKTPYKTGFSGSYSRSGRKGIFAGYHIQIKPGNQSLFAAGIWQPGKNELAMIRSNIVRSSRRLRTIISAPAFVKLFGEATRHPKGERQNIFGQDDELKVAPKGFDKNHKDIDLLKCRTFAVFCYFKDEQVLQEDFKDELARMAAVVRPFVHCLNDLMTIPNDEDDDEGEEDDEENDEVDDAGEEDDEEP